MRSARYMACWLAVAGWTAATLAQPSARPGWGSTPYAGPSGTGVTFRTWAPNAATVHVAGQFNGWNITSMPLYNEGNGVWSRDVSVAVAGHHYKYVINGNLWRRDPYGRHIFGSDTRNSIIHNPSAFNWGANAFTMAPMKDLVIYEMHIGAFYDPTPGNGQVGRFTDAIQKLDHLAGLGINAVELMPISEFPTATSWGYNLSYPFAIESSYGSPDDVKAFVKACHERGIAVLMDVVFNHWGPDDNDWSLWQYDGWPPSSTYGGIFFYGVPDLCCTWWGPRPDYSRPEVREYILENLLMWRREYRISGFRWDAPQFILYTDNTRTIPVPDGSNLINYAIQSVSNEFPGTLNIAEDIKGVVGFDSHWDLGYLATLLATAAESSDDNRNMFNLATAINGDMRRIVFTESHDSTGDLNNGKRLPADIDPANPESYWARKRSTLAAAIALTSPGTPMLWQGQEMLATNQFSDIRPLDWSRTNTFASIKRLYRDLIHLRRNMQGVSGGLSGDGTGIFVLNNNHKLIGWRRYDTNQPGQDVVVLVNFHNTTRTNYTIPMPAAGAWYVHVNTDDPEYGNDYEGAGPAVIMASGSPPTANISIGRYSALIASRVPRTGMLVESLLVDDGTLGNANGIAEPGETVAARLVVHNQGQDPASAVSAVLAAPSPGATVIQPFTPLPDIAAGGSATGAAALVIAIDDGWPCGEPVPLEVLIQHGASATTNAWMLPVGVPAATNFAATAWTSPDVPRGILDNQTVLSDLVVTTAPTAAIAAVVPWVRLNHTFNADLVIALQHPDGSEVVLSNHRGGSGDNFGTGTCGAGAVPTRFEAASTQTLTSAGSPFTGAYKPDGDLGSLLGKNPNGTWRLRVTDSASIDQGTLLCWGLDLVSATSGYDCETFQETNPDTDNDGLPDWWELVYFGGVTNATAGGDTDGDTFSNRDEFLAGTHPDDGNSFLKVEWLSMTPPVGDALVEWPSASNRHYRLLRATSLVDGIFLPVRTNIPATPDRNVVTDQVHDAGTLFYRIELE